MPPAGPERQRRRWRPVPLLGSSGMWRTRHEPGGAADNVLAVGTQQDDDPSCDDLTGNEIDIEIAIHDEEPVDQFRVVRNQRFAVPTEYGRRPTTTCQPALPLYVVVLTWTRLIPAGADTSRS